VLAVIQFMYGQLYFLYVIFPEAACLKVMGVGSPDAIRSTLEHGKRRRVPVDVSVPRGKAVGTQRDFTIDEAECAVLK